jgi:hypothetical protein
MAKDFIIGYWKQGKNNNKIESNKLLYKVKLFNDIFHQIPK